MKKMNMWLKVNEKKFRQDFAVEASVNEITCSGEKWKNYVKVVLWELRCYDGRRMELAQHHAINGTIHSCYSFIINIIINYKYIKYSFNLLIMYGSSYMFRHYIDILRQRS
jgi:uncharacterized Fe-S radical SAM superfamily protein PflX